MIKSTVSLFVYCLLATASLIFGAQQPNQKEISPKNALEVKKEYFRCAQCDQSFKSNDLFELHKKQHEGQKLFRCDLCPRIFLNPDDYTNHYVSHKS